MAGLWGITFCTFCLVSVMSLWGDRALRRHPVIPIHWNAKLKADGFASRRRGLSFMPAFSLVFLPVVGLVAATGGPADGSPAVLLGVAITALSLILCHAGHIWAVHRHFRNQP